MRGAAAIIAALAVLATVAAVAISTPTTGTGAHIPSRQAPFG